MIVGKDSVAELKVDILIAGGGTGGTAAALTALQAGYRVLVVEPTDWIGGQLTSQGVSCPDEHGYIEAAGGTRSYYAFRDAVRKHYQTRYTLSEKGRTMQPFNPGGGWVSRICFEPRVGVEILTRMLQPYLDSGNLQIRHRTEVESVERDPNGRVRLVRVRYRDTGEPVVVSPQIVLDATELGDVMPLAKVPYRTGMESFAQTGEPSAPFEGNSEAVQSFTYTFALEYCPGEHHVIAKPKGYEENKHRYSLRGYKMFSKESVFGQPFWTYRRIIAAEHFVDEAFPNDIVIINWASNDYTGGNIIDAPEELAKQRHDEAKDLSLGFLFWLQTEAPRDDGGIGYPELKLRPDIMGTEDGLSQFPYIRESRRLKSLVTLHEEDMVVRYNPGPRARLWPDSVGLGLYYYIDVHHCCNTNLRPGSGQRVRPFQIPLRTMLTESASNFVAAAKNIGTTHITNGAVRLHPIEWNIGESAGTLAAFALQNGVDPLDVARDHTLLRRYQLSLVKRGIPLFWFTDLRPSHPSFEAIQYLGVRCIIVEHNLPFRPDEPIDEETAKLWCKNAGCDIEFAPSESRAAYAERLYQALVEKEELSERDSRRGATS